MTTLDDLWAAGGTVEEYGRGYSGYVTQLLKQVDVATLSAWAGQLESACRKGRAIFCAGNGGSAATAAHFTTDLTWGRGLTAERAPRAISLVGQAPLMTAVANDAGYPEIFLEQLRRLFQPGDALVVISASGNSDNLMRAVDYVNRHRGITLGLVGFDGGRLKSLCHACVHVETKVGDYEPVEDVHHIICHLVASYVKRKVMCQAPSAILTESLP